MSYARKNNKDSDVYVVRMSDSYNCYACKLYVEFTHESMKTLGELWDHMVDHVEADHMVPDRVFNRISLELENETQP